MPGLDSLIQNKVGVGFPAENIHKKKLKLGKINPKWISLMVKYNSNDFEKSKLIRFTIQMDEQYILLSSEISELRSRIFF